MTKNRDAFFAALIGFVIASSFQLFFAPNAEDTRHEIANMFSHAPDIKAIAYAK